MERICVVTGTKDIIYNQLKEIDNFFIKNKTKIDKFNLLILAWEPFEIYDLKVPIWVENISYIYNQKFMIAEIILKVLEKFFNRFLYELIIFPSDYYSNNICVRIAKRLNYKNINFVKTVDLKEDIINITKKIYSSNLVGEFECSKTKLCISVENLPKVDYLESKKYTFEEIELNVDFESWIEEISLSTKKVDESFGESKFVVILGKGLDSKENIENIKKIFDSFKCKVGATRPVVMNGWLPIEDLIGVSGNMIAPYLCLTIGVSGQRALLSGISQSKKIISINIDKEAEINKQSDYVFNVDYKEFIKKIQEVISRR